MNCVKHTDGPWVGDRPYRHPNSKSQFRIASITGRVIATGFCSEDDDLRLLAAAPELLEALQNVLQVNEPAEGDDVSQWVSVINQAYIVIEKATGDKP